MLHQDKVELEGIVVDKHPDCLFTVEIQQENGENHKILCKSSEKLRKDFTNILVGDIVTVETSPYGMTGWHITLRGRKTTD